MKYITTGSLPPNSDRGRNFIIDPSLAGHSEVVGHVRFKFRTAGGHQLLATRRTSLSKSNKGLKL